MEEVKLHGMWASPFCLMVEVALKLKGVRYAYEAENLERKSEALLRRNPVHKTVPVLVHGGEALLESVVILEYVEETWKEPPLLPRDAYERARVRFWVAFLYDKFVPPCRYVVVTEGAEQEAAIREAKNGLMIFEEASTEDFPAVARFFHGDAPGMLDVVIGSIACWIRVVDELTGVKLVDEEATPVLCRRLEAFEEVEAAREAVPRHDELVAYAKGVRAKALGSKGGD